MTYSEHINAVKSRLETGSDTEDEWAASILAAIGITAESLDKQKRFQKAAKNLAKAQSTGLFKYGLPSICLGTSSCESKITR